MRCRRSIECQGAAANLARCIRNICVCAHGSHSNGAKCIESNANQLKIARTGCDEFGGQCRVHLIGPKRMAIFGVALERKGNENNIKADSIQKKPLYFNPVSLIKFFIIIFLKQKFLKFIILVLKIFL